MNKLKNKLKEFLETMGKKGLIEKYPKIRKLRYPRKLKKKYKKERKIFISLTISNESEVKNGISN